MLSQLRAINRLVIALLVIYLPMPAAPQETSLTNADKLVLFQKMRACSVKVFARITDEVSQTGTGVAIQRFGVG